MTKTTSYKVTNILSLGYTTYKPEMKECVIKQAFVIKHFIGDKHLSVLYPLAEKKQWEKTWKDFERDLNNWDSEEIL